MENDSMIDVDRILGIARELAFPRYPGTPGDARAMDLVEGWLRETGLEVSREPFTYDVRPAFRALRLLMIGSAVLLLAAGVAAADRPLLAAAALAVALGAGGAFLGWAPWLERIYAREGPTATANLYARRPATRAARFSVVLMAHHDSKSQNLTMPVRGAWTALALLGALLVALAVVWSLAADGLPAGLGVAGGVVAAVALGVLSTLRSGNLSPGGVDNAGSVGIVVELARVLPARVPADVDLWFLSPGGEEDHMVGAMRWLRAHAGALADRPVWALNLDGAGIPGRLVLLERYGFGRLFSAELSRLARRVARRQGVAVRGVLLPPAMGIDAIPFAHRGLPCLTLASGSLGRAAMSVHSAADVAEHLDRTALGAAARLAAGMVVELTKEEAPGP
jgi:hypothetical protein